MAVHEPTELSYRNRYRSWAEGTCPYCGKKNITATEKHTKDGRLVGEHFECTACHAQNFFSNKNVIEESA